MCHDLSQWLAQLAHVPDTDPAIIRSVDEVSSAAVELDGRDFRPNGQVGVRWLRGPCVVQPDGLIVRASHHEWAALSCELDATHCDVGLVDGDLVDGLASPDGVR